MIRQKLFPILLILFLPSLLWAQVDTLRPTSNWGPQDWSDYPEATWNYEKIDDVTADDDATYLYTTATGKKMGWGNSLVYRDSTDVDSVLMFVRAKTLADVTRKLLIGRGVQSAPGTYQMCGSGVDTVTLTSSYADYTVKWLTDPNSQNEWVWGVLNDPNQSWFCISYHPNDTVLQDNFDDNSLDTDKWKDRAKGTGSAVSEEEQRLELHLGSSGLCGSGLLSKSKYNRLSTYSITYSYQTNWDQESGVEHGYKGFFVVPGDTSGVFETTYGCATEGIWFGFGHGCDYNNDGIRIMADDDGPGWECGWDDMIDWIDADILEIDTWYNVRAHFNGNTGLCSMIVEMAGDDSVITGTVSSADLTNLGDSIRFYFHVSSYNNGTKEDRYDNFRSLDFSEDRITQSYAVVWSSKSKKFLQRIVDRGDLVPIVDKGTLRREVDGSP